MTLPGHPNLVSALALSHEKVALEWELNAPNATHVQLQRRRGGEIFKTLVLLDADQETYTDLEVLPGGTYNYRVVGVNSLGIGSYSDRVTVKVPKKPVEIVPLSNRIFGVSAGYSPTLRRVAIVGMTERPMFFWRPLLSDEPPQPKQVWWVSPDGGDTSVGSEGMPLRTIANAIAKSRPGDAIFLKAGVYLEQPTFFSSGTPEDPITLQAAPGDWGNVRLQVPQKAYETAKGRLQLANVVIDGARHIWLRGLVIEGSVRSELHVKEKATQNGIMISGGGSHITIADCVILHEAHCGVKAMSPDDHSITVMGCVIMLNGTSQHDHGIWAPSRNWLIKGNIIGWQPGFGVYSCSSELKAANRQEIVRNVIIKCREGAWALDGPYNTVAYNTCWDQPVGGLLKGALCHDNLITNNLLWGHEAPLALMPDKDEQDPKNNSMGHNLLEYPSYVNSGELDFRLQVGSAAIGTAARMPQSWGINDQGAYEAD